MNAPAATKFQMAISVHLYRGQGHKVVKVTKSLTFRFNRQTHTQTGQELHAHKFHSRGIKSIL